MSHSQDRPSLRTIVASAMGVRLISDTAVQFVFPYLPIFAAGLNVSIVEVGALVSIRALMGLFSPLFGWMAENRGYRNVMRLGLVLAGSGLLIFALSQNLIMAGIGMAIMGTGTGAFVPTLFSWASALLPFEERSRGLGAIELAWALAGMIGVSLVGLGIARFGWRAPLVVLAILLILSALFITRLPGRSDAQTQEDKKEANESAGDLLGFFDLGQNKVSAWAVIITSGMIAFANIHTFSAYAQWLVDLFALDELSLTWVAFGMGTAELISNLAITFFGDRLGPLRGTKIAVFGASVLFALLFWMQSGTLILFFVGLFVARLFMENAFVNNIILASEQTPEYRAKALTLSSAVGTVGLSTASWSGPSAYTQFGPVGLVVPSVIMFVLVLVVMQLFAKEKG